MRLPALHPGGARRLLYRGSGENHSPLFQLPEVPAPRLAALPPSSAGRANSRLSDPPAPPMRPLEAALGSPGHAGQSPHPRPAASPPSAAWQHRPGSGPLVSHHVGSSQGARPWAWSPGLEWTLVWQSGHHWGDQHPQAMGGGSWEHSFCCCSVAQLCPTLCDPVVCSTPGFLAHTVSQGLLKVMSIALLMPSNRLILCRPFTSCCQSSPASGSFPRSQPFASGGRSIGVSASPSALPMNTQD